jgi:hypothetical protein
MTTTMIGITTTKGCEWREVRRALTESGGALLRRIEDFDEKRAPPSFYEEQEGPGRERMQLRRFLRCPSGNGKQA